MTPARLLAPAALAAAAVALFAVVTSGSSSDIDKPSGSAATATPTAAPEPKRKRAQKQPSGRTHTVAPGDTPSGIAEKEDVELDALLEANPDIDPDALTVGDELKLP